MTTADEVAEVYARLEKMIEMAEAATQPPLKVQYAESLSEWSFIRDANGKDIVRADVYDINFIATASPDLLLRLAREALSSIERHKGCVGVRSCPEVEAVLRAWQP